MIERILKVLETAKVDGKSEQWFGYSFYRDEIEELTSLGYIVQGLVEDYHQPSQAEGTLVKWENK